MVRKLRQTKPMVVLNARGKIRIIGMRHLVLSDLYYSLLQRSWWFFSAIVVFGYLALNGVFAAIYCLDPDGLANARPDSFLDRFFFSVQTTSTVGYGYMYPKSLWTNVMVTSESIVALIGVAMITGVVFAKFSRPRARVIFSKTAVIGPHDGVPTLMFRVANERANFIADASIHVSLVLPGITAEGRSFNKMLDLHLVRHRSSMFSVTWTVLHQVNADSPLFGRSSEEMIKAGAFLVCSLTGYDSTMGHMLHARHSYDPTAIQWNMRLVDILKPAEDGDGMVIDYHRFHATEPDVVLLQG
jgi:inward rectifier potassium channel